MVNESTNLMINNIVDSYFGNCTSYNLIYFVSCKLFNKPYGGRTVSGLNIRMNQHISAFYKVLEHHKSPNFKISINLKVIKMIMIVIFIHWVFI